MQLIAQTESSVHWMTFVYPYLPLVGTLITAILSYTYWSVQQIKKERHEYALGAIKSLLILKEEFQHARNPFMSPVEVEAHRIKLGYPESARVDPMNDPDNKFGKIGYQGRLNGLLTQYNDVKLKYLELEALMGDDHPLNHSGIHDCVVDFRISVMAIIDRGGRGLRGDEYTKHYDSLYGSVTAAGSGEFDAKIKREFDGAVGKLRRHLLTASPMIRDLMSS